MATNTNALGAFYVPGPTLPFLCRPCLHDQKVYDCKTLAYMKSHLGSHHHVGPFYCSVCGHAEYRADHISKHFDRVRRNGHALDHTTATIERDQILLDMIVDEALLCKLPHAAYSPGNGFIFGVADAFGPVTRPGAVYSPVAVDPVIPPVVTPGNLSVRAIAAATATAATLAWINAPPQVPTAGQAPAGQAPAGQAPPGLQVPSAAQPPPGLQILPVAQFPPAGLQAPLAGQAIPAGPVIPISPAATVLDVPWCIDTALLLIEPYINRLHHDTDPVTSEERSIMEGNLRHEVAQIRSAQNATQVRDTILGASVIIDRYRQLMVDEGDEHEVAAIDEEKVSIGRLERLVGRLIAQSL